MPFQRSGSVVGCVEADQGKGGNFFLFDLFIEGKGRCAPGKVSSCWLVFGFFGRL